MYYVHKHYWMPTISVNMGTRSQCIAYPVLSTF